MPHLCVLPSQPLSLCSSRWQNTLFALTGVTPDISIIHLFTFYQPVFYATHDQHFPSESEERAPYWVGFGENCGFGEHCGDVMTHKLLDHENQKIIYRSAVRPQKTLAPHGGDVSTSPDPSEDRKFFRITTGTFRGLNPRHFYYPSLHFLSTCVYATHDKHFKTCILGRFWGALW